MMRDPNPGFGATDDRCDIAGAQTAERSQQHDLGLVAVETSNHLIDRILSAETRYHLILAGTREPAVGHGSDRIRSTSGASSMVIGETLTSDREDPGRERSVITFERTDPLGNRHPHLPGNIVGQ